jgi:hypothetical protein
MLQDALLTPQFFLSLHFPNSNDSEYASKQMAEILNIY